MQLTARHSIALALSLATALALGAPGCGGSPAADLCQALCDCLGCSGDQESECVEEIDGALEQAEGAGCGSEFEGYIDCIASSYTCDDEGIEDVTGCDEEREEVLSCGGAQEPEQDGPQDDPEAP